MRHTHGGIRLMRRLPAVTTAATVVALCTGLAAANAAPRHSHDATTTTGGSTTTNAPSGQLTVSGLLSDAASLFSGASTGWSSYGDSLVQQVADVGHSADGALAVTSAGPWRGATSPRFNVTPGDRYTATSWVLARDAAQRVGLGLRFFDAQGNLLAAGNQVGQGLSTSTSAWTATMPVVGFAPQGATTGQVVFLDLTGSAGYVQLLDDVSVTRTSGVAAPVAAPLHTNGNRILDRYGRSVTLRGVVVDGLQYTQWAQVSTRDIDEAHAWGANFVRIPLGQDFVLPNRCGYDTSGYLPRVDELVNEATALHMVSLIDLHTNALVPCSKPVQQKMPDQRSVDFWTTVANRYKNNPYVAFDLYNEPHDVTDQVWRDGGAVTSSGVSDVSPGMQRLYDTVRGTRATNLVVASGNDWASTFPASAPLRNTRNLVYGVHAYTCPQGTPESGATCNPGPQGVFDPTGILDRFDWVSTQVPLLVTEFGYPDTNEGRYIANVTSSVAARHWAGWSVFAFTGNTTGLWNLVKDTSSLNDPSIAGMAVLDALR